MSGKQDIERREVLYEGRVQGVGFRFRTHEIAARFAVAGFVKNLPDGRVQLVMEGNPGEMDKFLAAVASEMRGNIHNTVIAAPQPTGEFTAFLIRH